MINMYLKKMFEKNKIPVWMMRQAGRYMKDYRDIRKESGGFLSMCNDPITAKNITAQPINKFGMDLAIIFSDILLITQNMGVELSFEEHIGPILKYNSLNDLKIVENKDHCLPSIQAISYFKEEYPSIPLIGFAGGPFTVLSYIIEKGSSKSFFSTLKLFSDPTFIYLLDMLTELIIDNLLNQIRSGADIIKLFESNAYLLSVADYDNFVIKYHKRIFDSIRSHYPSIPIISFPRGSGVLYSRYLDHVCVDVLAIDHKLPFDWTKSNLQSRCIIQGNLDPVLLSYNLEKAKSSTLDILSELFTSNNFIFNLGHGVIKDTPEDNVLSIVNLVKSY